MGLICFAIGLVVGSAFAVFVLHKKSSGAFVIDFSDPAKDVCRLELSENLNSIYLKKQILLNVVTNDDISQE